MSATRLVDVLRKSDLLQYYPELIRNGYASYESLGKLNSKEHMVLGIHSIADRQKFDHLSREARSHQSQQQQQQQRQRAHSPPQITTTSPRKRPAPARITKPTIDRTARRMTLSNQPISRPAVVPKTPMRDRRMSYLPRREPAQIPNDNTTWTSGLSSRSPVRPGPRTFRTASPMRPKPGQTSSTVQKFMDDLKAIDKEKSTQNATSEHTTVGRLLDTYGVPIAPQKRRMSVDPSSGPPHSKNKTTTLEQYLQLKETKNTPSSNQPAQNTGIDLHQKIRVCVRKRPLSRKELNTGEKDIAPVTGPHTVLVKAPRTKIDMTRFTEQYSFTFDDAFDCTSTNEQIYNRTARPLVDYMLQGGKATCFAYGQTGSGKTYTMLDPQHGLYVLAAKDIFNRLGQKKYSHLTASIGFYEIYQNKLYDLLNQRKGLVPRNDGNNNVVIAGLTEVPVKDVNKLMYAFEFGSQARMTGKTGANNNSSRSHAVLQVLIKSVNNPSVIYGKLSFIDLAGSERGADRGEETSTTTRREGAEINKSLLALKECIRALDQDQKHAPFRGSKLTQVLRDSFIGDSRTCMIATISPNMSNSEHTLNTLRYADRVKEIKGESDPRLLAEPPRTETVMESNEMEMNGLNISTTSVDIDMDEIEEDTSHTVSVNNWDQEISENILDVEYPSTANNNAFGTPRNNRNWEPTTPQRQQNYMRRLSSPPEEAFASASEEPQTPQKNETMWEDAVEDVAGYHTPDLRENEDILTPLHQEPNNSPPMTSLSNAQSSMLLAREERDDIIDSEYEKDEREVSAEEAKDFLRLHRAQIKELDERIKIEKKMVAKFSLMLSSQSDFREEGETDNKKITKLYGNYLNKLDDILEQKGSCIESLRERIKSELGGEMEDDI
ncbi:P-loop containing nucleoside triphosphate hydrolase protein [Phycomyces nitens]|nr:P-loop containing nucleoside triphosphate hydrolase protein [Phycomyces nitens]